MSAWAIQARDLKLWFPQFRHRPRGVKEAFLSAVLHRAPQKEERRFWALKGISLEVARGEVLGVVGSNGSGKSTLLKVIAGIYEPDEGSIATRGRISSLLELGAGFREELTGLENIRLNGAILGLTPADIQAKLEEIVSFSELGDFVRQPLRTYSSGMKVRLGFSVASFVQPEILLIDEVLGVGDERFREKSMARIQEMVRGETTIVVVSHNLSELERLCDRLILVQKGQLHSEGRPPEVIQTYRKSLGLPVEGGGS